jgi:hypothetical protein
MDKKQMESWVRKNCKFAAGDVLGDPFSGPFIMQSGKMVPDPDAYAKWKQKHSSEEPPIHPMAPGSVEHGSPSSQFKSQAARDAQKQGYGDQKYWDYLEKSALENYDYYMKKGDQETAKLMLTRSLPEALKGNGGI